MVSRHPSDAHTGVFDAHYANTQNICRYRIKTPACGMYDDDRRDSMARSSDRRGGWLGGSARSTPRRAVATVRRRTMALNRDFYADCFARSALGRFDGAAAPKAATPFAAAAKKEFDLTSFLKDLAAVRDGAMRFAM